ncbi:hypothetical protein EDC01DRAFT_658502 [Geopyxis carbonaria]|nr:hypothetical protein EDC01DRAFT_658502 [Geopyxis carbonaria]
MPNFTGSTRRARNVNLSGKQSAANTQAAALRALREERAAREAERNKLKAVKTIQRTWRGRRVTQQQRESWRLLWDDSILKMGGRDLNQSETTMAVSLFIAFMDMGRLGRRRTWNNGDADRMVRLVEMLLPYDESYGVDIDDIRKHFRLRRLTIIIVDAIDQGVVADDGLLKLLEFLRTVTAETPQLADNGYYIALSKATCSPLQSSSVDKLLDAVLAPLYFKSTSAYQSFGSHYLTTPDLFAHIGDKNVERLRRGIVFDILASNFVRDKDVEDKKRTLWFLAHVIDFAQYGNNFIDLTEDSASKLSIEKNKFAFLTDLLDTVASEVTRRIDVPDENSTDRTCQPLPRFVKDKLLSLVEKSWITSILSKTKSTDSDVKVLARFAMTLLRAFPNKRDEVQMWLCLANTIDGVPSVRYAWEGVKRCALFVDIQKDPRSAISYLQRSSAVPESIEDEWHLLILFLEIYGFLLPITDDSEFFSGGPKGRQLPLHDVQSLTVFLKNLSFAAYWWAGDITGDEFRTYDMSRLDATQGWDLKHLRELGTKVMRAIYARDSRRHFLPKDHWLMSDRFTASIIPTVVQEEDQRQSLLENGSDQEDQELDEEEVLLPRFQRTVATITPHLEILQNIPFFIPFSTRVQIFREFIKNDQTKRRDGFVDSDLWRNNIMMSAMGQQRISSHHAVIRRGMEFQDAFDSYWELGDGLKEPIQITFVDKFGAEEAGIDGGGVTKEFLTGVCGEAFKPRVVSHDEHNLDSSLFVENAEHRLYPDPSALDRIKYQSTNSRRCDDENTKKTELLRRYEFAGRIVGKCLYEGILIDIAFAPFFLLKWSQPTSPSAVGVNDLRDLDADFYRHLTSLKNFEGDVESVFGLDFTVTTEVYPGKTVTRNLKPNGENTPVTNQNRIEYIHLVSKHRLVMEQAHQTNAFLKGLTTLIKPSWLSMFNQSELQTLLGGEEGTPIDLDDLKKNTVYGGLYVVGDDQQEHPTIRLFWQVMKELDLEQRGKVLKFVTSVSRAPLLGFSALRPHFSIRDAGEDQGRLCSASTCVNLLKLPRYSDANILKERLLYSVNSKAGFDLS